MSNPAPSCYFGKMSSSEQGHWPAAVAQIERRDFGHGVVRLSDAEVAADAAWLDALSEAAFLDKALNSVEIPALGLRLVRAQSAKFKKPRVALMQPHFLPWLGYFELMAVADEFIILDDFQFSRQSWSHRNRIRTSPHRVGFVTLPIRHPGDPHANFLTVQPQITALWLRKLDKTLEQVYGRSAHFDAVRALFVSPLEHNWPNIAALEVQIIRNMAAYLGIVPKIRVSSEITIKPGLGRSERVRAILEAVGAGSYVAASGSFDYMREDGVFPVAGIDLRFQNHQPIEYQHIGIEAGEFFPRLSAVDALFSLPKHDAENLVFGTHRFLRWYDMNRSANAGATA